jgi:DNA-binding GntR family transcriptional regulator
VQFRGVPADGAYGVAFHTVRHAMAVLRERGLIETVHGRGTFVKGTKLAPAQLPNCFR